MLQNAFSKARTATRNAYLHHRCPTSIHQRPSFALKRTEVAGHQSAFQSTNAKSLQRSYSCLRTYATAAKSVERSSLSPPAVHDNAAAVSNDTIYALSTAPGRAGIAIVRISGSSCLDVRFPLPCCIINPDTHRYTVVYVIPRRLPALDTPHYEPSLTPWTRPTSSTTMQ
jgi:hypothetical protein